MTARRRPPPLGQHFLHDRTVVDRIVAALDAEGRTVLEIGPGRGVLTRPLASIAGRLFAVELDRTLAQGLQEDPDLAGVTIHPADVMERPLGAWLPDEGRDGGYLLAGNLPYQITSPILFASFEEGSRPERSILMMQKEVAERLASPPGNRQYGILSVMAGLHARTRYLFEVRPGAFTPPPRVSSAVVRMDFHAGDPYGLGAGEGMAAWISRVVHAAFSQRRKMLRNSLKAGLTDRTPEQIEEGAARAGIDLSRRAETLAVEEFVRLAAALAE